MKRRTRVSLATENAMEVLTQNLKLARKRRGVSLAEIASKINASRATLTRLEAGDTGVGLGIYLEYLNQLNLLEGLKIATSPEVDIEALELEIKELTSRRRSGAGGNVAQIDDDTNLNF